MQRADGLCIASLEGDPPFLPPVDRLAANYLFIGTKRTLLGDDGVGDVDVVTFIFLLVARTNERTRSTCRCMHACMR